jgi:hypothetical protein
MIKFKNGRPFHVAKEVHVVTLQALIKICCQLKSFVVDLFTFTILFPHLSIITFHGIIPNFISN